MNRTRTSAAAGGTEINVNQTSNDTATTTASIDVGLRTRVLNFIAAPSDDDFDGLALAIHRYQYLANPVYRRFSDRLGGAAPGTWRDIPAVPAEAFRMSVLACGPAERVYRSSGTTAGADRCAVHHVPDAGIYRAAALAGFARAVLPSGSRRRLVVAAPERATHPFSSLGEMVTWVRTAYDVDRIPSCLDANGVDVERLAHTLDSVAGGEAIVLLAVTSALLRLADWAEARQHRFSLPAGSLIVDTGGCKGYERDFERAEVLARYRRIVDVPPERIVNEYGMTELASQLYATGDGPLYPPPWLRVLVCDLTTGRELPPGTVGCLRFFDLANLGSVLAIQTEDVGRVRDGGIEILGRAPGAVARGCSLLADEVAG